MALTKIVMDPDEKLTLEQNFTQRLNGRTISSGVVTISQLSGPTQTQPTMDAMKDGAVTVATPLVSQRIKNPVLGCSYLVKLKAALSDGDVLVGSIQIETQIGA